MPDLLPVFLNLTGRLVLLVGGGRVAEAKLRQLISAGARVRVVAPTIAPSIAAAAVEAIDRGFVPGDLDDVWFVVAAATPEVNRSVADAAQSRRIFVNAVDDPANATAYLSGVVRRADVTIAISTSGDAPALTSLIREALDALLPRDLDQWMAVAREQRAAWRNDAVAMDERKPKLLRALNELYERDRVDVEQYDRGVGSR
jgi:uroporphyrin-III C-methyltransferase/precorrin-2 dehydrogenase/sirohydrochlorin ferrochelatase